MIKDESVFSRVEWVSLRFVVFSRAVLLRKISIKNVWNLPQQRLILPSENANLFYAMWRRTKIIAKSKTVFESSSIWRKFHAILNRFRLRRPVLMSKYRYLILLSAKKWFRLTSFVVANVVEYYYLINTTQSLKIAFDSLARAVLNHLNTTLR